MEDPETTYRKRSTITSSPPLEIRFVRSKVPILFMASCVVLCQFQLVRHYQMKAQHRMKPKFIVILTLNLRDWRLCLLVDKNIFLPLLHIQTILECLGHLSIEPMGTHFYQPEYLVSALEEPQMLSQDSDGCLDSMTCPRVPRYVIPDHSTLTPTQMLQEAIGPINERFNYINEQTALNRLAGWELRIDPSFDFRGSDGRLLSVKVFNNLQPGRPEIGAANVNEPQLYTVMTKGGVIANYPCIKTNEGALIFVHDPTATGADKIYFGYHRIVDPQFCSQDENRVVKKNISQHIPRPMNAFIIYRNAEMATVRKQYPGIGNNDVSRIIGQRWRGLDSETRAHYKILAARSAEEHQLKHPGYKYTPRKPEDVIRRRKRSAVTRELISDRRPKIHNQEDAGIPPPTLHYLIPEFPDLDNLTNTWVKEPTVDHFNSLMDGFDCAIGLTTDSTQLI